MRFESAENYVLGEFSLPSHALNFMLMITVMMENLFLLDWISHAFSREHPSQPSNRHANAPEVTSDWLLQFTSYVRCFIDILTDVLLIIYSF